MESPARSDIMERYLEQAEGVAGTEGAVVEGGRQAEDAEDADRRQWWHFCSILFFRKKTRGIRRCDRGGTAMICFQRGCLRFFLLFL